MTIDHQVALATLTILCLGVCCEARVRLNSIRTVVLREGHSLPVNRSSWEPSLTLYQCMSDLECSEGSYCHAPSKGPAHSRCQSCRKRKRRCHRDGMCCPGNRCSNNVCVPDGGRFVSQKIPDSDGAQSVKERGWRKRGRVEVRGLSSKGQVGDPCLRSSDCLDGLCCARHFWTRICKPVLQEGQVCTRHRKKGNHGLELFQRCPCGDGLSCRTVREPRAPSSSKRSVVSSSSSSSSLLMAAAKSKFTSSSPSPSDLLSPLSPSAKSSPVTSKARLHMCQRN